MNRYLHAAICSTIGLIKCAILKVERRKAFSSTIINLISPGTEITVDRGGELHIGKLMKMRGGSKLRVRKGATVVIGDNYSMGNRCIITAYENIRIGNEVQFGPGVLVYDQDHDLGVKGGLAAKKFKISPITIGNNVWIGANAIILRGTSIGDNCIVGAGSVIKGNYPANSLIVQKRETVIRKISLENE